jgi:hypothetical protein
MPPATTCKLEPGQGLPYTAEFKLISTQLLASGDVFTHRSTEMQALDSHGRFFLGVEFPATSREVSGVPPLVSGRICDPVSNTQTNWDSRDRRAVILNMPRSDQRHGCWQSDSGDFRINFDLGSHPPAFKSPPHADSVPSQGIADKTDSQKLVRDDLGSQSFQGVEAVGYRSTWPPVESGQPDPPYLTEEHWVAPSLGIWISQEVEYPRRLNRTIKWSKELASLSLAEPDFSKFLPPMDFQTVTEEMHQVPCNSLQLQSQP